MKHMLQILALLMLTATAGADTLLIDRVAAKADLNLPQKSSTMNQVRNQYGDPLAASAAVGNPPITRWEYADFVVYYEHQHVITTVVKKNRDLNNPAGSDQ
jgi:hypothetical protein